MTKRWLELRIKKARQEYQKAKISGDPGMMKRMADYEKHLQRRLSLICRWCQWEEQIMPHSPFCSNVCHESWAKKNYPEPKKRPTMADLKKRIIEAQKRAHVEQSIDLTGQRRMHYE